MNDLFSVPTWICQGGRDVGLLVLSSCVMLQRVDSEYKGGLWLADASIDSSTTRGKYRSIPLREPYMYITLQTVEKHVPRHVQNDAST